MSNVSDSIDPKSRGNISSLHNILTIIESFAKEMPHEDNCPRREEPDERYSNCTCLNSDFMQLGEKIRERL